MSCDVDKATESLENELCCISLHILQSSRHFTYVTAHSPTLLSLLLRHRFSLTSPGEPPMVCSAVKGKHAAVEKSKTANGSSVSNVTH